MTEAEKICSGVSPKLHSQAVTLANAVIALQAKIEQQMPVSQRLPLAQTMTTTQGEKVLKNNPAMQEFRGTVRDYAASLKSLQAILDNTPDQVEESSVEDIRKKFKIAI